MNCPKCGEPMEKYGDYWICWNTPNRCTQEPIEVRS